MLAEIITIGDEILIGQIVDTNSAWIAEHLNLTGVTVKQITSISDDRQHILSALKEAESRADLILITGGLGPTKDDITKKTLCDYFKDELILNDEVLRDVSEIFASRGLSLLEVNRQQAFVPRSCMVLRNPLGTAPGMLFEKNDKIFIAMPGVPYEMKAIMETQALAYIKQRFKLPYILHVSIITQGVGESFLAERILAWEDSLGADQIKLAYLPRPGQVRLRLSSTGKDEIKVRLAVAKKVKELYALIPEVIIGQEKFGGESVTLQNIVGGMLLKRGWKLSVAESCTGGYLAHLITSVPGSSAYFMGSVTSYSNDSKMKFLNVKEDSLIRLGAVSEEVAIQMASGAARHFNSEAALSTTGVAGPGGGTDLKPVGLVWIGLTTPQGTFAEKFQFGNDRERNIERMSKAALNLLREKLLS